MGCFINSAYKNRKELARVFLIRERISKSKELMVGD